jgi:heavy metal translocating P-type ATPase
MLKKTSYFFSGVRMTLVSGIFLFISLIMLLTNNQFLFDPAWITVIISGYPLIYLAIARLVYEKWISSALLISIAMVASLGIGESFAAGEVAFIMAIGAILEDMTVARAKKGLTKLITLAPVEGRKLILLDGELIEKIVPVTKISVGDLLRVLPGEAIPVDGAIISGNTSVDQSIMTGESLPIDKASGDKVFCGTMNCFGSFDMAAISVGEDSSLQKLINLVKDANEKKAPIQRIADKWAVWLVPIALFVALATFIVTFALGMDVMTSLNRSVTVLVVFCPCALALATPTSIMAAIGQATKHGVVIKSGEALEIMDRVDTIAFDKTGTLTCGKLEVSDIISFHDGMLETELLALTASAEAKSEHPLGKAIFSHAKNIGLKLAETIDFQLFAGYGIYADVNGTKVYCGSEKFLTNNSIDINNKVLTSLEKLRLQGKASILVSTNNICIGLIALSDILRPTAKEIVNKLSELGTQTILLTGDNRITADFFARQVGITTVNAELLPEEKVSYINNLQSKCKIVCMIGDGVNDAPALKTANVSIAMGTMGSDIAVEAADIALMSDDISQIPYIKRLSKATLNTIKTNIIVSMCINVVAVLMSALGLLDPITGALVHNAGSVLVVLNAALLYDRNFDRK